jgi:hypothetical protein
MKDFFKTLLDTSKERLRNPLVGSFVFSWIIFNWKGILLITFSNKSMEDRILYVAKDDYSILLLLWFPLSMALFYVIALPYLSLIIDKLNIYAKRIRKKDVFNENVEEIEAKRRLADIELQYNNLKQEIQEQNEEKNKLSHAELKNIKLILINLLIPKNLKYLN